MVEFTHERLHILQKIVALSQGFTISNQTQCTQAFRTSKYCIFLKTMNIKNKNILLSKTSLLQSRIQISAKFLWWAFHKNSLWLLVVNYFHKMLQLTCLKWFWNASVVCSLRRRSLALFVTHLTFSK